jgi:hypothetical protein
MSAITPPRFDAAATTPTTRPCGSQNEDDTRLSYTDDAGTIALDTGSLPRYYRGHGWLGRDTITQPDDDLYAVLKNHQDMRQESSEAA